MAIKSAIKFNGFLKNVDVLYVSYQYIDRNKGNVTRDKWFYAWFTFEIATIFMSIVRVAYLQDSIFKLVSSYVTFVLASVFGHDNSTHLL